jgi:hypothetical protein
MNSNKHLLIDSPLILTQIKRALSDSTVPPMYDGSIEIKALVGEIDGLKIIIHSSDHNPPHFHITANNPKIDADFLIKDCSVYRKNTGVDKNKLKKLENWFFQDGGKNLLEKKWEQFSASE